jgi:hypothetical protein
LRLVDDQRVTDATDAPVDAVEVLRALAAGDAEVARAGGRRLAAQVMSGRLVHLAQQVLEGGTFIDARIAELCDAVLAQQAASAGRKSA